MIDDIIATVREALEATVAELEAQLAKARGAIAVCDTLAADPVGPTRKTPRKPGRPPGRVRLFPDRELITFVHERPRTSVEIRERFADFDASVKRALARVREAGHIVCEGRSHASRWTKTTSVWDGREGLTSVGDQARP